MARRRSLRTRLLFQYAALVVICMIVIPAAISKLLDMRFRSFVTEKLSDDQQQIVLILQEIYESNGSWNAAAIGGLKGDILRWPIFKISVYDNSGGLIRELRHQPRLADGVGVKRKKHEQEKVFGVSGELISMDRDILCGGEKVGSVRFLCLPFKDSREGVFLKQFNRHMGISLGFMLAIAVMIAFFMAERISRPVLNVTKRAEMISGGSYSETDEMSSNITELQTLIDSMNRLGLGLEAQEELRKRLMSDIAHELRNPVTIIKSHLEAIEDGVWEATPERVRLTVGEVDRLSRLISEVERLTTIEGAGKNLTLESAGLSDELEKIALAFDPLYKSKSVTLERQIERGVTAAVDISKLRQAVENLLSNALRYTDEGGAVLLSMKSADDAVEIEVKDSGIGISQADLPYIFERFYRTDKSRARESGGIGIGLAITKAIIEAHGGTIRAESSEGNGSRFIATIPNRPAA